MTGCDIDAGQYWGCFSRILIWINRSQEGRRSNRDVVGGSISPLYIEVITRMRIIEVILMTENRVRPIHPGEILREEYLKPMGLSANALSLALRVPATRIGEILKERRGVTPDTALRLAKYFNTDPQSWMNLQTDYDLKMAVELHGSEIDRDVRPMTAAG